MPRPAQGVYRPRNPRTTDLFALVEDHFDELERVWEERYECRHGFWHPIIRRVVDQYLACGDLRCGFARLWCSPWMPPEIPAAGRSVANEL